MNSKIGIGIVAPSYSMDVIEERWISIGITKLKSLGFNLKFGENIKNKEKYSNIAGSVTERINDINRFLLDDSIDIIMPVIGGYGANQLLANLDYELIKKTQKKFIGFSDTTILLNAIYKKAGIYTYLGPSFVSFCNPNIPDDTINSFMDVVINEKEKIKYYSPDYFAYDDWYMKDKDSPRGLVKHKGQIFIQQGKANGFLVGGNCESLLRLVGTEFFPDMKNSILLIEDVPNENPDILISELTQLKDIGVFDEINGLIVGQFGYNNKFYESKEFYSKIRKICSRVDIPILVNTMFSHVDPLYTIKIGGQVLMDSSLGFLILNNKK